jgi:hypothetical protein
VTRVVAFLAIVAAIAGVSGCTTTQKVVSGAAIGGGTGLLLGGPVGGLAGAAIGGVAVPVGSHLASAD